VAINVVKPSLPDLSEFKCLLESVWSSGVLTHHGPLLAQFEAEFRQKFGVENFCTVANGTVAIELAIQALALKGEIITTPFTWVSTITSIIRSGCKPVFCDIDPYSLNMDPRQIERLISKDTVGILPVHVFGNPCEIDEIIALARTHGLKVIFDAAHAVGSTWKSQSILNQGDAATVSFHATKILNMAEGGGVVSPHAEIIERIQRLRFFGYDEGKELRDVGTNAKVNELQAALGLLNLRDFDKVANHRREAADFYRKQLQGMPGIRLQTIDRSCSNQSYFPIVLNNEIVALRVMGKLGDEDIFARRYFYPSLESTFQDFAGSCPNSSKVASSILCLPLFFGLTTEDQKQICDIIKQALPD